MQFTRSFVCENNEKKMLPLQLTVSTIGQHLFLESPIAQVLAVLDFANTFDREGHYPAVDQEKN